MKCQKVWQPIRLGAQDRLAVGYLKNYRAEVTEKPLSELFGSKDILRKRELSFKDILSSERRVSSSRILISITFGCRHSRSAIGHK